MPRGAADDWCGPTRFVAGTATGHGSRRRQPIPAAMPQAGYGRILARRRVRCGPSVAADAGLRTGHTPTLRHLPTAGGWVFGDPAACHQPVACPHYSACYETLTIITGLSLTCSYPMMGEEG